MLLCPLIIVRFIYSCVKLGPALSLASAIAHHWASSLPPLGDPLYSFYFTYILMK